jgi:hypothetical protein
MVLAPYLADALLKDKAIHLRALRGEMTLIPLANRANMTLLST